MRLSLAVLVCLSALFLADDTCAQSSIPTAAIKLIKDFEGFRSSAYPNPRTGGEPWTIGYGTTRYCNGNKVRRGDTITNAQATSQLLCNLQNYVQTMRARIPTWSAMNNCQKSAIISFGYNLGPDFYSLRQADCCPSISRALSTTANWRDVPAKLQLYTSDGRGPLPGLVRRRKAEAALWNSVNC